MKILGCLFIIYFIVAFIVIVLKGIHETEEIRKEIKEIRNR